MSPLAVISINYLHLILCSHTLFLNPSFAIKCLLTSFLSHLCGLGVFGGYRGVHPINAL
ncbi:hypothetical protein L873DRAFT_873997 [Choiromyces venosus 120613-1]|uniref:Uncharacterized protein n=1 Tax=Choiromyces venosus 120613-1 TaxID=1336337 RepID=A0A3N4JN75_9PEZI|nr:hypothetical protein L873DRAFT_873997 [Choiromyces venosus 120613-1]